MIQSYHEIVERTRQQHFDSQRNTVANIEVHHDQDVVRIRGEVLDQQTAQSFIHALRVQAPSVNWRDEMTPLVTGPDYHWALTMRAVADLRREPRNHSERVSQTLFGEPIEVLRYQDDWAFVRASDGYLGWMHVEPLHTCTMEVAQQFRQQTTHVIKHPLAPCYVHPSAEAQEQCALLPFGTHVTVDGQNGAMLRIRWPDGTVRWTPATDLMPLRDLPQHTVAGLRLVEPWLNLLIGVPYLWGGKSPFGYDCSGLMQVIFNTLGVHLRRDADQQAQSGESVAFDALEFGDLIFFDTNTSKADILTQPPADHVTHVGLALSRTNFIHSSWRGGGVIWGSFDPQSPFYAPTYDRRFICARRYLKAEA